MMSLIIVFLQMIVAYLRGLFNNILNVMTTCAYNVSCNEIEVRLAIHCLFLLVLIQAK